MNAAPTLATASNKKPRKKRTVPKVRTPRGLKLTLAQALTLSVALKSDDVALFEKLVGILNGAGKGQRKRVLKAIGDLYA